MQGYVILYFKNLKFCISLINNGSYIYTVCTRWDNSIKAKQSWVLCLRALYIDFFKRLFIMAPIILDSTVTPCYTDCTYCQHIKANTARLSLDISHTQVEGYRELQLLILFQFRYLERQPSGTINLDNIFFN